MHALHQPAQQTASRAVALISAAAPRSAARLARMFMLVASLSGAAVAATSVSQYGITWTFSQDRPVGQFANGDWWVVGPVTITGISPRTGDGSAGSSYSHGSMLNPNPGQTQGFYNQPVGPGYDAAKNVALQLPLTVQPGNSVYSTMNNPDAYKDSNSDGQLDGDAERVYFKETAILTVLSSAPPDGSFRPPYAGTNKTIKANWNSANINYSALRSLPIPIPANAPSLAWLEEATRRPLLEMHYNWDNSSWKAAWSYGKPGNYPRRTYGREVAGVSGGAGLMLNTNLSNTEKRQLAIYMIQWGIDIYGLLQNGMQWQANGGHQLGRLLPLYLAGKLLNDSQILALAKGTSPFQEMSNHFFVTQEIIDTPRAPSSPPRQPYTLDMLGMPEWCHSYPKDPNNSAAWYGGEYYAAPYRSINGGPNCGTVATILVMGGRSEINQEAYFRYHIERYYPKERPSGNGPYIGNSNGIEFFTRDMWDAYVSGSVPPPVDPPPAVGKFSVGNRIQVWRTTSVYGTASTVSATGSQQAPNLGTIVEGPVGPDSQNVIWYRLDYDNGPDGWSGEDNFLLSQSPPASTFKVGDRIKVWRQTWVNNTAAVTSPLGQQPAEALGVIAEGPVTNGVDNIFWFKITYDSGPSGWSGADNLIKSTTTPSSSQPTAPTGLRVVQ